MKLFYSFYLISLCLLYITLIFKTFSNTFTLSTTHLSSPLTNQFICRRLTVTHYTPLKTSLIPSFSSLNASKAAPKPPKINFKKKSNDTRVLRSGTVVSTGPGTNFTVLLDESNKKLRCTLSGRLFYHKIRIWNKSRVKVQVDLMYPETGTIVERDVTKRFLSIP